MKALKIVGKIVLWIVGIAILLVLTLPLWIGPLVKGVANGIAPSIVKTDVHLADFGLNYYSGVFHMGGFSLENPSDFTEREAFTLGEVRVEVDPLSTLSDVVHVKLIRVKDVFAAYVFKDGDSNISRIAENVGGEKTEAEKKASEPVVAEKKPAEKPTEEKPAKKVIIDRVEIGGIVAQIGPVTIPLTPNELVFTDIGKDSGGATLQEVYDQIVGPIAKVVAPAVETATMLGGKGLDIGKDGLKLGADGLGAAVDAAKKLNVKGATDALKSTGDALKGAGDGLKSVGDDFKKLFK